MELGLSTEGEGREGLPCTSRGRCWDTEAHTMNVVPTLVELSLMGQTDRNMHDEGSTRVHVLWGLPQRSIRGSGSPGRLLRRGGI